MNDTRHLSDGKPIVFLRMVKALGWFSIGLGLAEALMPARVSRASGIEGNERLVRGYGAREILNGVGILTAKDPAPWLWARVAGDVMDISTLASRGGGSASVMAVVAVAGVTALDIACATRFRSYKTRPRGPKRDYSDRRGMPASPDQMRGAALRVLGKTRPLSTEGLPAS
jgi:hypothetical protein